MKCRQRNYEPVKKQHCHFQVIWYKFGKLHKKKKKVCERNGTQARVK